MKRTRRSARQFNVISHQGHLRSAESHFTSGLFAETSGTHAPVSDNEVIAAAFHILSRRMVRANTLSNPRTVKEYLAMRFAEHQHEVFTCLYLDNRNRVIACEELFRGTVDGASVHPREVVKRVLAHNAAAVILSHNHPSGVAEPSQADEIITQRLKDALSLIDVRVLDHLVVGGHAVTSFAERGLI